MNHWNQERWGSIFLSIFNQLSLVLFVGLVPPLINYFKCHQFPNLIILMHWVRNVNSQQSLWVLQQVLQELPIIFIVVVPYRWRFSFPWCPNSKLVSISVPLSQVCVIHHNTAHQKPHSTGINFCLKKKKY